MLSNKNLLRINWLSNLALTKSLMVMRGWVWSVSCQEIILFLIKQIKAFLWDQVDLLFCDFENIYSPIICVAIPTNLDTFKVLVLNVSYYFEYFGTKNLYIHRKIPFDLKARFEYSMLVRKKNQWRYMAPLWPNSLWWDSR